MSRKRKLTPNQKAALWLRRICKLTGAEPAGRLYHRKAVRLRVGNATFRVGEDCARKEACGLRVETCHHLYQRPPHLYGIPTSERIANALLWLKAYPKEFDRWAARGVFNKKNLK
jgi:hypothetical protein